MKNTILSTFLLLCLCQLYAQLPNGFSDEAIDGPWDLPVGVVFDASGNGYIWTSTGRLYFIDTLEQVHTTPLLDISEEVGRWLDHGMLSLVLDPNFIDNGKIYLLYCVDTHHLHNYNTDDYDPSTTITHQATIGRLTRYALDLNQSIPVVIPESRKVLIGEGPADGFSILSDSHGVGGLAFGTDGSLLASCGDSGSSNSIDNGFNPTTDYVEALEEDIIENHENVGSFKSQVLDNLNGKLIRIDPETGYGLPTNPFYDPEAPDADQSKVWALGLRNPWRIYVVPESGSHELTDGQPGHILVGDVGDGTWEEINLIDQPGQNFGWPIYEGFEKHPELSARPTRYFNAPNPLSDGNDCKDYFNFQHLLLEAGQSPPAANPCDPSVPVPDDIPSFEHQPPLIAYRNQTEESSPYSLVATIDDEGKPVAVPITETGIGEHFQGDASMAGLIYQGDQLPEPYRGAYFHADFRGWIKTMQYDIEQGITRVDSNFHKASEKIVSLAEHPISGYLYYISLEDKKLHRIKYGGPSIPHVEMTAIPSWGEAPLEVIFDASPSFSSDSPLSFNWDFGDGSIDTSVTTTHVFDNTSGAPQSFDVKLSVRDTFGQERTKQLFVSINNTPPKARITYPLDGDRYPIDLTSLIRLGAEVEDKEHKRDVLQYQWEVFLHHNTHFHPSTSSEEQEAFALIAPLGCYTDEYWYRISLTVTDPQGANTQDEVLIYPECDDPFIAFIYLRGKIEDDIIRLEWEDITQETIAYYELQRTEDFLHFSTIDISEEKASMLLDTKPLDGANMYRIKAVSKSGAFRFSDFVIVDFPADFTFTLYPNPMLDNSLTLALEQAQEEYIRIRIFDASGRLLIKEKVEAVINQPLQHKIELKDWPDGLYYYLLENGEKRSIKRFVK